MRSSPTPIYRHLLGAGLCLLVVTRVAASDDFIAPLRTDDRMHAAAKALGFCMGQQQALDEIARVHPALAPRVEAVSQQFTRDTGDGCGGVDAALKTLLKAQFPELQDHIRNGSAAKLGQQLDGLKDLQAASTLLDAVALRADGRLEDWLAPTLVDASREYRANPLAQWSRWRMTWDTSGDPDALGAKVHVGVPIAFVPYPPERSRTLQIWTQSLPAPAGRVVLAMTVAPYDGQTMAESVRVFAQTEPHLLGKQLTSSMDAEVRAARSTTTFGRPAVIVTLDAEQRRRDQRISLRIQQLIALVPESRFMLTCTVELPTSHQHQMQEVADRYDPLCNAFFRSLTEAPK